MVHCLLFSPVDWLSCPAELLFFFALPQSTLGTLAGLSSGVSHFHRLAGGPISGPSGSFVTGACLVDPNLSRTDWTTVHDSAWYHFSQFRSFAFGAKPNCETAERPPQRKNNYFQNLPSLVSTTARVYLCPLPRGDYYFSQSLSRLLLHTSASDHR